MAIRPICIRVKSTLFRRLFIPEIRPSPVSLSFDSFRQEENFIVSPRCFYATKRSISALTGCATESRLNGVSSPPAAGVVTQPGGSARAFALETLGKSLFHALRRRSYPCSPFAFRPFQTDYQPKAKECGKTRGKIIFLHYSNILQRFALKTDGSANGLHYGVSSGLAAENMRNSGFGR